MTIPSLIAKHQKHVTVVRLKETYSKLGQMIEMAKKDYGDVANWDVTSDAGSVIDSGDIYTKVENFVEKYMLPYLNVTKNHGVVYFSTIGHPGYNSLSGTIALPSTYKIYIIELPNGTYLMPHYQAGGLDGGAQIKLESILFMVDINGKKGPNVVAKDLFYFYLDVSNGKVIGFRARNGSNREVVKALCLKATSTCSSLIMYDGWQIAPDYPW